MITLVGVISPSIIQPACLGRASGFSAKVPFLDPFNRAWSNEGLLVVLLVSKIAKGERFYYAVTE